MKIQVILHEEFEGLGCIEKWILTKGYALSFTRTFAGDPFPVAGSFDWLIIMGGGMSVYEREKYPFLNDEISFIHSVIQERKTVLGICLGSQLIAHALGSNVYPAAEKEIGWFPVHLNRKNFPAVLKTIPERLLPFHWHGDTFDLPKGAVHLASSKLTPNQAFLYSDNVLALQYHYEVDETAVKRMLDHIPTEEPNGRYIQSYKQIISGIRHTPANNGIMFKLLDYLERITQGKVTHD